MKEKTRELQYQRCIDLRDSKGLTHLGLMTNQDWYDDPKHLVFMLSRYKFVAKMLSGSRNVLEVGCGDAFAARIVLQEVKKLTAIDFDPVLVKDAVERMECHWKFDCKVHNILEKPLAKKFDGIYALDVLEHVPREKEESFMSNIVRSITEHGVLVIGMPSIQSQKYASALSKEGHVNCKDSQELKKLMLRFFHNVFIFSMNDELVHTGFYPMAQYLFALCVGKRKI